MSVYRDYVEGGYYYTVNEFKWGSDVLSYPSIYAVKFYEGNILIPYIKSFMKIESMSSIYVPFIDMNNKEVKVSDGHK